MLEKGKIAVQRTYYQSRKEEGLLPGPRVKPGTLAALDIGSSKVCALVAQLSEGGKIDITGYGMALSNGMRRGVVVDVDGTVRAVREAVEKAEDMAQTRIRGVTLGVAGTHVQSVNVRGVIGITRGDKEIFQDDVDRALEAARVDSVPQERQIIHVLPRQYIVDGYDGIFDPVGMVGNRLEVEANMVTCSATSLENITRCVARANLHVETPVLASLASGEAVLHQAERELGVAVADIGCGTTDVGIFDRHGLYHAGVIPVGGEYITKDLAVGLRTPLPMAEKIKIQHGVALVDAARADDYVEVPDVGGSRTQKIGRRAIAEIIQPRVEEIFGLIMREIIKSGRDGVLPGGIVITGGTATLEGIVEVGQDATGLSVRVGYPEGQGGLTELVRDPACSCAVGIICLAAQNLGYTEGVTVGGQVSGLFGNLWGRVRGWVKQSY